jgi:hypothetical protein
LAWALEQAARELSIVVAARASLKTQISRWENGHVVAGPEYRALFRVVYGATDAELGFTDTPVDEVRQPLLTPFDLGGDWSDTFHQAMKEWKLDVERRQILRTAAYATVAATTPALQWLLGDQGNTPSNAGDIPIGPPQIEGIREMANMFRALDNRFGGAHARESLVRFLSEDVATLVRQGGYSSEVGSQLLSVTAEAIQLAGWMTFDAGHQGLGQRYMTQALKMAQAAGDRPLGAEILAGLSHQASYLHHAPAAVDLARAAGKTARECGIPALIAEAAVMEAHGPMPGS